MHVLLALLLAAQNPVVPARSPASDTAHVVSVAPTDVHGRVLPAVSERDSTVLRVLAINDFHGALEARAWPWSNGKPVGGAAALKPWLDSLARTCSCTTVRVDGGDEMQGTLLSNFSFGLPAIAAMNAFGIDVAADRKSTRLNSSHGYISYAVFCLKKKTTSGNCTSCCS